MQKKDSEKPFSNKFYSYVVVKVLFKRGALKYMSTAQQMSFITSSVFTIQF